MSGSDAWARRWGWVLIPVAVLLVYWPLSTFTYGPSHGDLLDCWLPWRWTIASALHDGHFPLWDPYQQMGYPLYADLQGPSWYPEALALGGTIGQSLYVLQALFLAYVMVGGWGMQRLMRVLYADARIGVIIGLAYALGGFFCAHEMHFYAVISAAWLPWLLAAQLRLMRSPGWRPAVEAAIIQFLCLTGGNHTFTILGTYLVLALIAVHVMRAWKRGDRSYIKRLIGWEAAFALGAVVMACGTLFAWWEVAPYLSRAAGLAYANASAGPFTWTALRSVFLPYAVGTDADHLGTDPAMANGYFGVVMGVLALLALVRRRSAVENTIAVFGLVCALASFGDALPVHRWLWSLVPGLDLFRFPSYYWYFTAIAALMLAGGTCAQWTEVRTSHPRMVQGFIAVAAVLLVVAIVRAWVGRIAEPSFAAVWDAALPWAALGRMHRILVEAPIVLLVLIGFLLMVRKGRSHWAALLALVAVEMGWNTSLAQWNTAVGDYSPAMLQSRIDEQPRGPVWPELHAMGVNTDDSRTLKHTWRNTQDIIGRPTHDGFNSFWLKDAAALEREHAALWNAMKRQPLLYLSDSVVLSAQYTATHVDAARDSALIVLPQGATLPAGLHCSASDRVAITGFDHDRIAVRTSTGAPSFLLLQQAWYPGWTVSVDGLEMDVQRANIAAFGAWLPAGEHAVEFTFSKPVVPWLLAVSLLTFLVALTALALSMAPGMGRLFALGGTGMLAFALGWSLFGHRPKAERVLDEAMRSSGTSGGGNVVNTDRPSALGTFMEGEELLPRANDPAHVDHVLHKLEPMADVHRWIDLGLPTAPAVRAAVLDRYRIGVVENIGDACAVELLTPADSAWAGPPLFSRKGQVLSPASPYTEAYRVPVKELCARGRGALVISVEYTERGRPKGNIVIEQRRNGVIVDYESVPMVPDRVGVDGRSMHHAYLVRSSRELRHPEEELGIYLWNDGPDTLVVKDFRVRWTARDLTKW